MSQQVIELVYNIAKLWEECHQSWKQLCDSRGLQDYSASPLGAILASGRIKITEKYNYLADRLGKSFAEGDEISKRELITIAEVDLINVQNFIAQATNLNDAERTAQAALEKTITVLDGLASHLGHNPSRTNRSRSYGHSRNSSLDAATIPYCDGALLMQAHKLAFTNLVRPTKDGKSFTCKYCYLEISSYQLKSHTYTQEDWSLLTSCHVVACASFKDRRAGFRCPACYSRGMNAVESSPETLREHLDVCKFRKDMNATRRSKGSDENTQGATYFPMPSPDITNAPQPSAQFTPVSSSQSSRGSATQPVSKSDPPTTNQQSYEPTPSLPTRPAPVPPPVPAPRRQGSTNSISQVPPINGYHPSPVGDQVNRVPGQFPAMEPGVPNTPRSGRGATGVPISPVTSRKPAPAVTSPINAQPNDDPRSAATEAMNRSRRDQISQQQQQQQQQHQQQQYQSPPQQFHRQPKIPDIPQSNPPAYQESPQYPQSPSGSAISNANEATNLRRLVEMGVRRSDAKRVLGLAGGDLESAVNRALGEGLIASG